MTDTGKLSRRSLFAKAAVAAVAVAAPTIAIASPTPQPKMEADDPVIALAQRVIELYDAHGRAIDDFSPFDMTMMEWRAANPTPVIPERTTFKREEDPETGLLVVREMAMFSPEQHAAHEAQWKRQVANWRRRERRAERRTGYRAAELAAHRACDASINAMHALADKQPSTIAGLAVKAKTMMKVDPDGALCDWRYAEDIAALGAHLDGREG